MRSMPLALSERFAAQIRAVVPEPFPGPGTSAGIECEYAIYRNGLQIDFRKLIREVVAPVQSLTEEGTTRFRLPDGRKLSCDGWYAEIATPPEPTSPDSPQLLARQVTQTEEWLESLLRAYSLRTGIRL